ncbi:MAG: hypothetical protein AAFP03_06345 [Cyanobacteria bacterium J06598_3]
MNNLFNYLSTAFAWLKPALVAASCALVIFTNATPALAFGNSSSKPTEGLEQLDKVQQKSENAVSTTTGEAKRVMNNAQEGLNGVQGKADKDKMTSPQDANGTSIKEKIEDALEDIAS